MKFTLYRLKNELSLRISLSYAVDQMYWREKSVETSPIFSTHSLGKALQLSRQQKIWNESSDHREQPFTAMEWNQLWKRTEEIEPFLQGRNLLWPEVEALLHKQGKSVEPGKLVQVIQLLTLQGKVEWKPGVDSTGPAGKWQCSRCFAGPSYLKQTPCARCGGVCVVCEHCILLGKSRTCIPLFQFAPAENMTVERENAFSSSLLLTPAQQIVTQAIRQFLVSAEEHLLVWAVTGAGKTEVMIPVLEQIISQGRKVLWTTPRKDVVLELAPRLRQYFPDLKVVALYGGSADLWKDGSLVIATAHQTWRYVQSFDLAVIDEVDAFPLYGNPALEQGIERSLRRAAKKIFLTATPPLRWKQWMRHGTLPTITLPVRYHGYPLPVPRLHYERRLWKKLIRGESLASLSHFFAQMNKTEGQALLFVPRVQDVNTVLTWLKDRYPQWSRQVAGVFAQDRSREKHVQSFREQQLRVLVTTTILERGVTVPRCHVGVIGADHPVFDAPSLIQIAGRVGRSREYQQGEVWFVANEKTEAQTRALQEIRWLNDLAKKEGFLKEGAYFQ